MTMAPFPTITEALEYAAAARQDAHGKACPPGSYPCAACVQLMPLAKVLDIIREGDAAPSTVQPARLLLHDAACRSGCEGEHRADHAKRHADSVAALRRFVARRG